MRRLLAAAFLTASLHVPTVWAQTEAADAQPAARSDADRPSTSDRPGRTDTDRPNRGSRGGVGGGGAFGQQPFGGSDNDERREAFLRAMQQRRDAEQRAADEGEQERVTVVIPIHHAPVAEVAEALGRSMRDRSMTIVPEMVSNSLLVSLPPDQIKIAEETVRALDRAPNLLRIEFGIIELAGGAEIDGPYEGGLGDLLKEWGDDKRIQAVERASLTTLEGQVAQVQIGMSKAVPSGRSSTAFGGRGGAPTRVTQYQQRDMGTLVTVNGRVAGDDVLLEVNVERSGLANVKSVVAETDEEAEFVPPEITTLTVKSTIRVTPGHTVLVTARGDGNRKVAVLASVRVEGVTDRRAAATGTPRDVAKGTRRPEPVREIKVFNLQQADATEAVKVIREIFAEKDGDAGLRLEADIRVNRIIASGSSETLEVVEALLLKLDEAE